MNEPTADFYEMPAVYDVLHGAGTAREVDGLERIARRFCGERALPRRGGAWLEPACGTARHLRVAARRGCRVAGVDLSESMLAYARERLGRLGVADRAILKRADMAHLDRVLGRFRAHLAFCLINSIRHVGSDEEMLSHLNAVGRVLHAEGVYAVGLSLSSYGNEQVQEDIWKGSRGRCTVTQVVQYIPATSRRGSAGRFERVISHLTIRRPGGVEHIDLTYRLLSYDYLQWMRLVERSSLEIAAVVDEQGRDVPPAEPGYSIFILRRK